MYRFTRRGLLIGLLLALLLTALIIYFFFPQLWHQVTSYAGPGSPFVKTP